MTSIAFINIYQNKVERGAETYVAELSKRLAKDNEVKVLTAEVIPNKRWPFLWRFYLDPFGIQTFWQTIKFIPEIWKNKYDFVIPVNGGWQPAIIRLLTWCYGGKMIISGQSGKGWDDRNNLWCFPDAFVALTEYGRAWAKKVNPFVNVDKIPNGVDLKKFASQGRIFKVLLKAPIVVCQGALEPSKRLDLAIKAVAKLKDISLLLVGKGSLKDSLTVLGKKLLGDKFEIISVSHEKMPEVYRLGSVFTLPSWSSEAFGISYIEAMATNLPVVATDDLVRREIVGDSGIFVNPENIDGYSLAIEKALKKNWGVLPRKQAEKFNWDSISKKYEDLFQKLNK